MNTTSFWKYAIYRAVRTILQTALALLGTATFLSDVQWMQVLSASAMSGLLSLITSIIAGIPEAPRIGENGGDEE